MMQEYIQESQTITIRPLKPLVYNFFQSERPESTDRQIQQSKFQLFNSHRIESNNHFKPTINFKKIDYQPKLLLSLQKKKSKVISGISQKAESQRPSRNSYRGSKLRTSMFKEPIFNQEEFQNNKTFLKEKEAKQDNVHHDYYLKKSKQPHLNFNLRLVLQKRKTFTNQYSRESNIQGTSFPYHQYFSSKKSSLPQTQQTSRSKTSKKMKEKVQRYISTTQGVRTNLFNESSLSKKLF